MAIYRFELHNDEGQKEHLGVIDLLNDGEAIVFGGEVRGEIIREPDPAYQTASLEITEGGRQVGSLALVALAGREAYGPQSRPKW